MAICSYILLRAMRTKVEVVFEVKVRSGEGVAALGVSVKANAKVCYGENLKEKNMADFLESRVKAVEGPAVWVTAVGELEEKLIARGRGRRNVGLGYMEFGMDCTISLSCACTNNHQDLNLCI